MRTMTRTTITAKTIAIMIIGDNVDDDEDSSDNDNTFIMGLTKP